MFIQGIGAAPPSSSLKKKEEKKDKKFTESLSSEESASTVSGASSIAPIDSLFTLQEVDPEVEGKNKAIARGFDALDYLEGIRIGLLTGMVPESSIRELEHLIQSWKREHTDPRLTEIVQEIDLRVQVELEKIRQGMK